jgi:hypothetical protein
MLNFPGVLATPNRPWMLFLAAVGFLGLEHSLISGKNRRFFSFDLS